MLPMVLLLLPGVAPLPNTEARALVFLSHEVPLWHKEHRCYSCHNNGDAARALYVAHRLGWSIRTTELQSMTDWLMRPEGWDKNGGGEGRESDKKLARLQFAAALVEAERAGLVQSKRALQNAALLLADQQNKAGAWPVVPPNTLGGPTAYAPALSTFLARDLLVRADRRGFKPAIARADAYLRQAAVDSLPDAAGVLLAIGSATDADAVRQRRAAFAVIRQGEAREGGWGPYATSPPEVFDTAVVMLALVRQEQTADVRAWLARGRAFLCSMQNEDGSWPETTRPSGAVSYSQQLSTTGWATLALLQTSWPTGRR